MRYGSLWTVLVLVLGLVLPGMAEAEPPVRQTPRAGAQLERSVPPAGRPPAPGAKPALPPERTVPQGKVPRVPGPWEGPSAPKDWDPSRPGLGRRVGPMPGRTPRTGAHTGTPSPGPHPVEKRDHPKEPIWDLPGRSQGPRSTAGLAIPMAIDIGHKAGCWVAAMRAFSKLDALYQDLESQFPEGQPFWVEVKVEYLGTTVRSCPQNRWQFLHPEMTCPKKVTVRAIPGSERPAEDRTEGCTQTVYIRRVGKGDAIRSRADVGISISPARTSIKLCQGVNFAANVTFTVNGRPATYDASSLGLTWSVSDPQGLQMVQSDTDASFMPAGSTATYQFFRARKPGTYTVMARLYKLDPKLISDDPVISEMLSQQLISAVGTARVTVAEPTLKEIRVAPRSTAVRAGGSATFSAKAFYEEACYMPRGEDITEDTGWSLAEGEGSVDGPVYTAAQPRPLEMTLHADRAGAKYEACDTATLQATLKYEKPEGATVRASYAKEGLGIAVADATVRVTLPRETENVSRRVEWSPARQFNVGDEAGEKVVSATYPDPPITREMTLTVKEPTLQSPLEVKASKAQVQVGEKVTFSALARYKQDCVAPVDVTSDENTDWKPAGNVAKAEEPGGRIERRATYTDPTGRSVSGSASAEVLWPPLVVDPDGATFTLGQEVTFHSFLANASFSKNVSEESAWPKGRSFSLQSCGPISVSAKHTPSNQQATATIDVRVDESECAAIREALRAGLSPDHLEESKKWLERRNELQAKGCDCGVKPTWTAGETETEVVPDGDEVGPGACDDPRRELLQRASLAPGDGGGDACGPCKSGYITAPGGDGEIHCWTPDEIAQTAQCPRGTVADYIPEKETVGCFCPSKYPVWDGSQCIAPPEPTVDLTPVVIGIIGAGITSVIRDRERDRRRPPSRKPPGKKCHRKPGGGWHCGPG